MRIAMVSTLTRPVPPVGEGSVELLVSLLTERLVARGHEVTLFATADSRTAARLESPVATSYVIDSQKWDWQLYETYNVREAFRRWREFDVIHSHSYYYGLLYADLVPIPSLHSIHIEPGPDYKFLARRTRNRHFHFCSRYQARDFDSGQDVHIIPHGIETDQFFLAEPGDRGGYLAYLGRFHQDKGALRAIRLARQSGLRLKLAGPSNDYLRTVLMPEIDGRDIEYVGEVAGAGKAELLAQADALLYPVERGEPFGLVLIEAMACGTPVVAVNQGAVPEIVEHGVTGWIGQTDGELLAGLENIRRLDRAIVRRLAVERFSADTMAQRTESVLQSLVGLSLDATGARP